METEIKMSLSTKLVSLRKQKGLTQMELAEKLNVSRQAISRWEVGAAVPSTDNLKFLGDLYGVSVDYLLDDNAKDTASCVYIDQPQLDDQGEFSKRKKSRRIFIGMTVALIVTVIIGAGLGKIKEKDQVTALPMENMTIEEGEVNPTVIFSFE